MGENSGIQWTTHTFNPWEGCARVSPGCQHCYAEARNHRFAGDDASKVLWGTTAPRRRTSAANWRKPLAWDRAAAEAGVRHRVFCASLADVFEDRPELVRWRLDLLDLIRVTPHLDWLLLTKRPQDIRRLLEEACASQHGGNADLETATTDWVDVWLDGEPPSNVWLGTTVEDQRRADERIPHLLRVPAEVRFLSCEPLLERVDLSRWIDQPWAVLGDDGRMRAAPTKVRPDWVIIGGESGPGARPFALDWARDLVAQCRAARVAPFVKQLGARPLFGEGDLPDSMWQAYDTNGYDHDKIERAAREGRLKFLDSAGGDPTEWPADLRVREFPHA